MPVQRPNSAGDDGPAHVEWNEHARGETPYQQLDRNWEQLLQELRVTQTGVQIFAGILLSLPFQNGFTHLSTALRGVYLCTVLCAVAATIMVTSPVAMHRLLFRRQRIDRIVDSAHHFAVLGLILLALALVGAVVLAVGATAGLAIGISAGVAGVAMLLTCWVLYPLHRR